MGGVNDKYLHQCVLITLSLFDVFFFCLFPGQLFYLVTDLYKEGNAKEMRKWAYEIHSIFLVPGAPLRLNNVDENVASEIDDVLLKESDKEEKLRKVWRGG